MGLARISRKVDWSALNTLNLKAKAAQLSNQEKEKQEQEERAQRRKIIEEQVAERKQEAEEFYQNIFDSQLNEINACKEQVLAFEVNTLRDQLRTFKSWRPAGVAFEEDEALRK